jgi:FKBP-type peptidyl-prolyl cis-trans isomerase
VYYRDSLVGNGASITDVTDLVVYEWIGYLKNGNYFGLNQTGGDTVSYANGLLPTGVRDGMLGMRVGGKRLIVVPSALAYGAAGAGVVPPNATIIMSIHLLDIVGAAPAP